MGSYGSDWDDEKLVALSREFLEKHVRECTSGELRLLVEVNEARKRLAKLDAFLAGLR